MKGWELIAIERREETSNFLTLSRKGFIYEFEFKSKRHKPYIGGKTFQIRKHDLNDKELVKNVMQTDIGDDGELRLVLWNLKNSLTINFPEIVL